MNRAAQEAAERTARIEAQNQGGVMAESATAQIARLTRERDELKDRLAEAEALLVEVQADPACQRHFKRINEWRLAA